MKSSYNSDIQLFFHYWCSARFENYKDKKKNALNFLKLYGDPFDQIFIDKQGTISINFGAYGVPETFLVNEDNKVLKKYIGLLNDEDVYEIKNITNN